MPDSPELEATYKRFYGTHTIEDDVGEIHILSQPTWETMYASLENDLPDSGVVLTPEYSLFPEPLSEIPNHRRDIDERVEAIRGLSRKTEALIMVGAPMRDKRGYWFNGIFYFKSGVLDCDLKTSLSTAEKETGIIAPHDSERKARYGRTVLICSEILPFSPHPRSITTPTILVPSCWAVPPSPEQIGARAVNLDEGKYRGLLNLSVDRLMGLYPEVNAVVVADRNLPDSNVDGPFNAVFRRVE